MDTLQTLHLLFRRAMHAHQDATGVTFIRSAQMLDSIGDLIPAAQVQVTNAERARDCFWKETAKSFNELRLDIVVNVGHGSLRIRWPVMCSPLALLCPADDP